MYWHPQNLTIPQRLLALTALAMLPAVAVVAYYIASLHQQREREVHSLALQYSQMASLEIDRMISGAEGVLEALAHAPSTADPDAAACSRYLAVVSYELPQFLAFGMADATGMIRCSSTPGLRPLSGDRAYFDQAIETRQFVVGEFALSSAHGQPMLPLALPLPEGSQGGGAIITGIDLDWLGEQLRERNLLPGSSVTIADRNGIIVAREPFPERFVGTPIPDAFQPFVRSNRPGSVELASEDGTPEVLGYYPPAFTGNGLYVGFGLPADAAFSAVTASTYRSMVIALTGAAAVFAIAWIVGQRLFCRPIQRLLETIAAWKDGDDSVRTGIVGGGSELAVLAAAIDGYMGDLVADRAARRQAEKHRELLVRELDHRVKNILATVQAVAAQSFRNETCRDRVEAFSQRLRAMAETHRMLMAENWANADLRATLETALRPFECDAQERFLLSGPPVKIRARAALALSMTVHELCTNAVKYGALRVEGGHVSIAWSLERRAEGNAFTFRWSEHDGPVISPPKTVGFGSRMIRSALSAELSAEAELDFRPSGLVCTIEGSASEVCDEPVPASSEEAA